MHKAVEFGPWNPGIESQLPRAVLPFSTILRPENVLQTFSEIEELSEFTGLPREEIACFRPQRLAVHELLIRISANYSVADGNQYEDLGVNFRRIAQTLLDKHVRPNFQQFSDCYEALSRKVYSRVELELTAHLFPAVKTPPKKPWWQKLTGAGNTPAQSLDADTSEARLLERWLEASQGADRDELDRLIFQSLNRVCSSVMSRHGRIRGDLALLSTLVSQRVCNGFGSKLIGALIEPIVAHGAQIEGYTLLPIQQQPIVLNVKGSSAAGKSTLRPLQHQLVQSLGYKWEEFALISPDIFRKFLLDYASLGEAYKYAGICTGHELKVVDQKLDLYMANKALQQGVPHLLIDRFRFDSFAEKSKAEGSNLLTRFGATVYMFYMLTPPHITVERAYTRGLKVGRFKAVDDLLDHNVETFTGMPHMFFTWALNREKEVHYEFLDNTVDLGERPLTVAYGNNGLMTVRDVDRLMDIDRFQKININALTPDAVYPQGEAMEPDQNTRFVESCLRRLQQVDFIDGKGQRYACVRWGESVEYISEAMRNAIPDDKVRAALLKLLDAGQGVDVEMLQSTPAALQGLQQTLGESGLS